MGNPKDRRRPARATQMSVGRRSMRCSGRRPGGMTPELLARALLYLVHRGRSAAPIAGYTEVEV